MCCSLSFRHRPGSTTTAVGFDVYNIDTLPVIDLEAIENHLRAAKEEDRRVRIYI